MGNTPDKKLWTKRVASSRDRLLGTGPYLVDTVFRAEPVHERWSQLNGSHTGTRREVARVHPLLSRLWRVSQHLPRPVRSAAEARHLSPFPATTSKTRQKTKTKTIAFFLLSYLQIFFGSQMRMIALTIYLHTYVFICVYSSGTP